MSSHKSAQAFFCSMCDFYLLVSGSKSSESRKNQIFTEGWVEFTNKRVAREVASTLNNTQVGGNRRSPWYADLWNIKYLPRFTWGLLNERLAYERAVHRSRLRTEVAIVKRESEHFARSVKQAKRDKKTKPKSAEGRTELKVNDVYSPHVNTNVTLLTNSCQSLKDKSLSDAGEFEQTSSQKKDKHKQSNSDFLKRIFSGGFRQ